MVVGNVAIYLYADIFPLLMVGSRSSVRCRPTGNGLQDDLIFLG